MPSRFRSQLTWTAEEAKVEVLLSGIDVKSPNKYFKDIVLKSLRRIKKDQKLELKYCIPKIICPIMQTFPELKQTLKSAFPTLDSNIADRPS